ncbi:hypothetical protein ACQCLI_09420 [Pseudomonas nitroreducens]|uniref:hypothetical protein n=1 Tax=Pseudomonas nitroreducens TaxID=46680 RepID=UPI0012FE3CFB|nr:hypothetical protein [Pseudomonas nitroreducens]
MSWIRPATPLLFGILSLAITTLAIFVFDPNEKHATWWISLSMQVLGLSLSAGALCFSAIENAVAAPWKILGEWLSKFPAWRKKPIQIVGSAGIVAPGVSLFARGTTTPPPSATTEEKFVWLNEVVNGLHKALAESVTSTNGRLASVEAQLITVSDRVDQSSAQIEAKIRSISVANFYQVFAGLTLLSLGSIISLFVP